MLEKRNLIIKGVGYTGADALYTFGFYIYYQDELKTLDDWIRETDLSGSFYFGGTLDYHY